MIDVITLKLNSGEEVIGRYEGKTPDQNIILKKPVCLAPGQEGFGMIPWIMSADADQVEINRNSVIGQADTIEEIAKKYLEVTSGIALAS
jgi:hypothetical protein